MRELYDVVRRACDACIAEIRDGVPAVVPHEAAKRVIGEAGLERGRVHTSGYGLAPGFPPTWGEPLHMLGGSPYTLRAGMVVSVEPPVFLGDERIGARIIDNVLVTQDGRRTAVALQPRPDRGGIGRRGLSRVRKDTGLTRAARSGLICAARPRPPGRRPRRAFCWRGGEGDGTNGCVKRGRQHLRDTPAADIACNQQTEFLWR